MISFFPGAGFIPMALIGVVIFAVVIGFFVFVVVKAIREKVKNDASPRLTVDAFVSSKRISVSSSQTPVGGDATGAHGFHTTSDTSYFVTFEVQSGDRMEFSVKSSEYGMLSEGDVGRLSFQGTRYLGFERDRN